MLPLVVAVVVCGGGISFITPMFMLFLVLGVRDMVNMVRHLN